MKKLFCLLTLLLCFHPRLVSALTFNITYDTSVTQLTNAAEVENAFATAAAAFSNTYTNVAKINITMYWGPGGHLTGTISLGRSFFQLTGVSYSAITNALWTHRASDADTNAVASLPGTDPTGGSTWWVPLPEARVLGLYSTNNAIEDGEVAFATNLNYTFDPNNRSVAGKFDFIAAAQHELSEILGRANGGLDSGLYLPYDLFRFTNSGARSLTLDSTTNAYFSLDDGATALKSFYTNHLFGDVQDWKSSAIPDAFDAFVFSGRLNPLGTNDFTALDVLGYNGLRLEPPHLYGTTSNGNYILTFVNSPGVAFTVLGATNIATPKANWSVLGTATESATFRGQFAFTNSTTTSPIRFYMVTTP
jgi:hypothetical protein